ncbi:hypothetical protein NP511_18025 [Natrinema thermotolerans]|uniref:DUF7979 domain-containing protein n=1 Tax=Natrinema thermotolerans TaxID=121872 RepID=A0AAF0PB48_9EURY|nr:hypothetical protein [Natrinema thermotolerans]QCC60254.1 hypothetical protein DVR14_17090 [Natrinema thermotolerans]QCC61165.1 hypothetical protein DVR14_21220 [Natrinema thermotolerans]WMT07274.1 hypothetical protein NP511_18025 [Natrinema thermotolerans]
MSPSLTLEQVDEIPSDSRVCHYDELGEDAKEELPTLTGSDSASVDRSTAEGFQECDLVKYTDYYEISVA